MSSIRRTFDGLKQLRLRLVGSDWRSLPRATRLTILGLLGWCVLAAMATVAVAISIESPASTIVLASTNRVSAIRRSAGAADAVVQRPLFASNRQPATDFAMVPQVPAAPVVVQSFGIVLRGVFMDGKTAKAYMTTAQEPTGAWVAADQMVDGWRLVAVRAQEVELEGQGRRIIVPYSTGAAGK